jgi:DNA-binding protein HU-beta
MLIVPWIPHSGCGALAFVEVQHRVLGALSSNTLEIGGRYCYCGFHEISASSQKARTSQRKSLTMSKAFLAQVIQDSVGCTGVAANQAATDLVASIVKEMKKSGGFTLPSFGTFTVRKTKARKGMNPRTGEPVKIKAGKTVRFKASPNLKKAV